MADRVLKTLRLLFLPPAHPHPTTSGGILGAIPGRIGLSGWVGGCRSPGPGAVPDSAQWVFVWAPVRVCFLQDSGLRRGLWA